MLAVNGSVLHVTYGDTGADSVFYARSTDNGVNWAPGAMGYTIDPPARNGTYAGRNEITFTPKSLGPQT